ncbi:MAG: hypothetical protein ACOVNU_02730 [Candidatus Kapaibacteriota bacterium]
MKSNQLRIGNYVLDNLGGILKIQAIGTNSDLSHIQPILITEDWLIKLGFEKIMSRTYKINLNEKHYLTYYLEEKGVSIGYAMYCTFDCKYVHSLQNLYFTLTNKELIYNSYKLQ